MIKPCPFCNSNNISAGYYGQPAKYMFIQCHDCGAQGPNAYRGSTSGILNIKETLKVVMDEWNKRSAWISVENQIPKIGQHVLVVYQKHVQNDAYFLGDDGDYLFWYHATDEDVEPAELNAFSHWQPLPPPPEE